MSVIAGLGGVVLCGGQSARMGSSKAWLDFDGEPLLARVVRVVAEVTAPVVVVAAPEQAVPALPAEVIVARDPVAGRGPLQGIAAGLDVLAGRIEAAFVSSTDAPFLHAALIRRLAALRAGHDVAVPRAGGHLHPLCAVYGVEVRAEIEAMLASGNLRVTSLFDRVRARIAGADTLLADEALRAADPALRSLSNVNTPEEYAAARAAR